MFSLNKTAARTLLVFSIVVAAAVPLTAMALRSRTRPVRIVKARFLGGQLLADGGLSLQQGAADCGPTALRAVFAMRGIDVDESAQPVNRGRTGWSTSQIVSASGRAGLPAAALKVPRTEIANLALPAIALLGTHYVVIERRTADGQFIVFDPDIGRMKTGSAYLSRDWTGAVVVFPTPHPETMLRSVAPAPDRHLGRIVGESQTSTAQRSIHA